MAGNNAGGRWIGALLVMAVGLISAPVAIADVAPFYQGKRITLYIGTGPGGGGYDT